MNVRSTSAPAPGALHVDALPVGTRLGEFEILALLGVGGFGMVYRAFDHSLHRAVAIKEFMPAALVARTDDGSLLARSPADQSAFMAGLKSFVGEARLLAQFDHPSLVKVFRFWEAHNTAYMVMPLYSGMTFKQARAQMRTPPPEAWLRQVMWSVLGALRTLHESQTLHRDISPDNIFLQDTGPPVLLDLGAARHAINDRDHKHTAVLKVNYAPIEQYADGDAELVQGPWSDLYALAAVVYGCLCNDKPLPSTLRAIRDRMVPFARVAKTVQRQFGQAYSATFVAAISQALALQPGDRPQSIDAFLQAMEMVLPPAGLEHFDFRADLGDIWVEPTDRPVHGLVVPTVDLDIAVAAPLLPRFMGAGRPGNTECVAGGGDTVVIAETGDALHVPARVHTPVWWAAAVVAVAATIGYGWTHRTADLQTGVLTELAQPPAAAASASAAKMAAERAPPNHAMPTSVPAPPPTARAMAPHRPKPSKPLCADTNFFTRSACLYRECAKPAFAAVPVCVEHRRRVQQQADQISGN